MLGYRQLHEQASRRATEWARQGVKAGAKVCLFYSVGSELLISLAAALGLGACISFLPPQGKRFIARRLAALAPDHIAAEPHQVLLLEGFEKQLLHSQGQASPAFTSHTYKPDEPVGLLFSPLVEPPGTPAPLLAEDAWRGALVDGLLTFGLGPGEHLAAPGYHPLQHLPAFLFTTLLRGATYLHLELSDLEANPALLTEHPVRALGVTPALRDLLLRARTQLKNVAHWFRNPEEPIDWLAWRAWVKQCGLSTVPSSNVLVDSMRRGRGARLAAAGEGPAHRGASRGGTSLGAARRQHERPAGAGRPGRLHPVAGRGAAALPTWSSRAPMACTTTGDPVRRGGTGASTRPPRSPRSSSRCPSSGVPPWCLPPRAVWPATTATCCSSSPESRPQQTNVWLQEIRRCIELQLGAEHLPDRTEFIPLYPRKVDGQVDEAWCHAQYLTGALHRKSSDPLFQALTALRGHLLEKAGPGV